MDVRPGLGMERDHVGTGIDAATRQRLLPAGDEGVVLLPVVVVMAGDDQVGPGGRLIPDGGSGIVEWVKAEDLERMETYVDYGPEEAEAPTEEESFDIF